MTIGITTPNIILSMNTINVMTLGIPIFSFKSSAEQHSK